MNEELAFEVLQNVINRGVTHFCICPGARNSPFVPLLLQAKNITKYYWFEERSSAFFALGRSKSLNRPVAVITTSGTAAAELLPATMEAYYSGVPLVLITADRPRRFRGTGAPQSAEQVGLFGQYAPFALDLAGDEKCSLDNWSGCSPAHLNVCFEEPVPLKPASKTLDDLDDPPYALLLSDKTQEQYQELDHFLNVVAHPLVVVSALKEAAHEPLIRFLQELNAPVYIEATSGLREESRLAHLRIMRSDQIWKSAEASNYPIDGILRIGGVPTVRLWRDLEDKCQHVRVCSISDLPFSGLSRANVMSTPLHSFFAECIPEKKYNADGWLSTDREYSKKIQALFEEEPQAEPSLVNQLSRLIPSSSMVYLGNSLPIREWDFAAVQNSKGFQVYANRGVNGIDGQVSTFLGMCSSNAENWGIVGDLTMLYDLAGPWILSQLPKMKINLVVINNSGGQIFAKMFPYKEFLHQHSLHFAPVADLWGLKYEKWQTIPSTFKSQQNALIEIVPDSAATDRFWQKAAKL